MAFSEPPVTRRHRCILGLMQTRYLLVASVLAGLAILVAAAVWMATRL